MASNAPELRAPRPFVDVYTDGSYLEKNPTWHVEESPFKVKYIAELLRRNPLPIKSVCEAGCGVGEVLRLLQLELPPETEFTGFDIAPHAHELSRSRENGHLHFKFADITAEKNLAFDLMLVLDVLEHLEDYFSFLRSIRPLSPYKIFHFPLDLSVQAVIRKNGLLKRRVDYAHLHYFSKETALETLVDTGYKIRDYFYAPRSNEIGPNAVQRAFRIPRAALFAINQDVAARLLGGYTLMVLAE